MISRTSQIVFALEVKKTNFNPYYRGMSHIIDPSQAIMCYSSRSRRPYRQVLPSRLNERRQYKIGSRSALKYI